MAKKEGKPVTHQNLPDPNDWKLCKHSNHLKETLDVLKYRSETQVDQNTKRVFKGACAVFLEDFCFEHLSEDIQYKYGERIEKWVRAGNSLAGANLLGTDLQGTKLPYADLQGTILWGANLDRADLFFANLQKANLVFAELKETILLAANLQEAYANGANFRGARLERAFLQNANLEGANLQKSNLAGANLRNANLNEASLQGAFLQQVAWEGALHLSWKNILVTGEEKNKKWREAKEAYRRLESYFREQGQHDDAIAVYVKAKIMEKREAFWEWSKGHQPDGSSSRRSEK